MERIDDQPDQEKIVENEDRDLGTDHRFLLPLVSSIAVLVISGPFVFARWGLAPFLAVALVGSSLWLILTVRPMKPAIGIRSILLLAIALRVPMMFASPDLSGDVWRYLWDGRVSSAGIDPYALPPSDPALESLREPWHDQINHPEIRTIYPPYAQLLFLIPALGGSSLWIWRMLLLIADLLAVRMLHRRSLRAALLWSIFPLAVWEGFWSAHLDLIAGAVLLSAILVSSRPLVSGAALGLATGIKLIPAFSFPVFLARSPAAIRHAAGFFAVLGLSIVPFVDGPLMGGFDDYARRWSFNGLVYTPVVTVIEQVSIDELLRGWWTIAKDLLLLEAISPWIYAHLYPDFLARVLLASMLLVGLIVIARWKVSLGEGVADSLGLLMLFSPTVHPWYWLPVAIVSVSAGRTIWLFLAVGSIFSYLLYEGVGAAPVLILSYILPAAAWYLVRRTVRPQRRP